MLTGAGGLLGNPPLLANLNSAIADSGFYYTRVGDTGNPSAFGSAIFRNRYITTGTGSDIVIDGTGSCWYRYNNGSGSPQGFRQSWDSGSLPASPSTTAIAPNSDNTKSAGTASLRFTQVYAASGTINTSDAREKTAVSQLTQDEMNCAKQLADEIGTYQWLASIQEKGANARTHIGMTVQRAIEIFQSNNLDPFKYGIVCFDSWEDEIINHPEQYEQIPVLDAEGNETGEYTQGQKIADAWDELKTAGGNRYGFRYEQLNLFIARGLSSRLSSIEQRLQAAGL